MQAFSRIISILLAVCLAFFVLPASSAFADEPITANTPMPDLVALQEKVDAAQTTYEDAIGRVAALETEIIALNERIAKIQSDLPKAKKVSEDAAREYYRMISTTSPLLEMVFDATSVNDFFSKVEYSNRVNQSFLDDITRLSTLNAELEAARAQVDANKLAMEAEQVKAEEALLDAQTVLKEAEEAARKIALASAAAAAAASGGANFVPALDPVDCPENRDDYIALWGPRIDSYLAGSPLGGYGDNFAAAAFDYNVDPRWSPAISTIESSKGRLCFLPHNAWGWGKSAWSDWPTAIDAHVAGLSRGYGYSISRGAASKYCPPHGAEWFTKVCGQMMLI